MSYLIRREDALVAIIIKGQNSTRYKWGDRWELDLTEIKEAIESVPTVEPKLEIIRCADCKWWDRLEEGHPYGDCRACRSGTQTEHWDIHIQRQTKFDFYCADAELKENEDNDE